MAEVRLDGIFSGTVEFLDNQDNEINKDDFTPGDGLSVTSVVDNGDDTYTITMTDGFSTHSAEFTIEELESDVVHWVYPPQVSEDNGVYTAYDFGWCFGTDSISPEFTVKYILGQTTVSTSPVFDSSGYDMEDLSLKFIITPTFGDPQVVTLQEAASYTEQKVKVPWSAHLMNDNSLSQDPVTEFSLLGVFTFYNTDTGQPLFDFNISGSEKAVVTFRSDSRKLRVSMESPGGSSNVFKELDVEDFAPDDRFAVFFSFSDTEETHKLIVLKFRNGSRVGWFGEGGPVNGSLALNGSHRIFSDGHFRVYWHGGAIWTDTFIDWSLSENRDRFINQDTGETLYEKIGFTEVGAPDVNLYRTVNELNVGFNDYYHVGNDFVEG